MEEKRPNGADGGIATAQVQLPLSFVPTPTREYWDRHGRAGQVRAFPIPTLPIPVPLPLTLGARVLIWKQDPSVPTIGIRKAYLPGIVRNGPADSRFTTVLSGTTPVVRNAMGDFIFTPNTPEFDCAHTFAVARETLTMYQRALGGRAIPWAWNQSGNTDPITAFPRAGVTPNAYYSRGEKALKFFYFTPPSGGATVYTCRSLDIVAHETGHAILDGLKPGWLGFGNPPQTGGLHESFGDLTAIFLALSQMDQVEAIIAETKANLHDKNFLAELAEQFGSALGRPNGLRNADNDLKLSQVSTEVHAISQVFTGGVYDVLADIFALEYRQQSGSKDPAQILFEVAQYIGGLVLRSMIQAPANAAKFSDVVNRMLHISNADGKPASYRQSIRRRFTFREVVVSPTPMAAEEEEDVLSLQAGVCDAEDAVQNRSGCCGTMQLPEYMDHDDPFEDEVRHLQKQFSKPFKL